MPESVLARAFADLDDGLAINLVKDKIKAGENPLAIVAELQAGMDIFSRQCQQGDFFISDLILAGDIFQQSMHILEPLLETTRSNARGPQIVLGTVKGDIHNLGKDILAVLLKASGFTVHDLGINVAPEVFVQKVRESGAGLVGLSGLITPSFDGMKATVQALEAAGLRSTVKVIIGGGVVSEIARQYSGADAFSTDAIQGLDWCKNNSQGWAA
jgi:methanogenic corrinoid protein MtbC1